MPRRPFQRAESEYWPFGELPPTSSLRLSDPAAFTSKVNDLALAFARGARPFPVADDAEMMLAAQAQAIGILRRRLIDAA